MKKNLIIIFNLIIWIVLLQAQDNTDYFFFGENRAYIPGIELMNSTFSENPAKAAEGVNNSIAYTGIFIPGEDNFGQGYTMSIPNFSLVNVNLSNNFKENEAASREYVNKELLGIQFALSLQDFITTDNLNTSMGIGFYRIKNYDYSNDSQLDQSFILDLGNTLSLFGSNFEFLITNLMVISGDEVTFFGENFDMSLKMRGRIILDIDYTLGVSSARGYGFDNTSDGIDFITELAFIRFFFSSSLRTGVRLEAFTDLDNSYTQIPVIKYTISVNYSPFNRSLELFETDNDDPRNDSLFSFLTFLAQNLTFNLSTEMVIKNSESGDSFVPIIALGATKYY